MRNPFASEQAAFAWLLGIGAITLAVVAVVLLVRTL